MRERFVSLRHCERSEAIESRARCSDCFVAASTPAYAGMTARITAPASQAEWITQFDAQAPKIPRVARHEDCAMGHRGRRHQRVGHVQRSSFVVDVGAQAAREAGNVEVDRQCKRAERSEDALANSVSRARRSGAPVKPEAQLLEEDDATQMSRSRRRKATTPGSGRGRAASETTLVSSRCSANVYSGIVTGRSGPRGDGSNSTPPARSPIASSARPRCSFGRVRSYSAIVTTQGSCAPITCGLPARASRRTSDRRAFASATGPMRSGEGRPHLEERAQQRRPEGRGSPFSSIVSSPSSFETPPEAAPQDEGKENNPSSDSRNDDELTSASRCFVRVVRTSRRFKSLGRGVAGELAVRAALLGMPRSFVGMTAR